MLAAKQAQTKDTPAKPKTAIFGTGPHAMTIERGVKASAVVAPIALLMGYLHRRWGVGANADIRKGQEAMGHYVGIGALEPKEASGDGRALLSSGIEVGSPLLTAGALYLIGIKLADKHRIKVDGKRAKQRLAAVEQNYDRILHSRLYPSPEEASVDSKTASEKESKPRGLLNMVDSEVGSLPLAAFAIPTSLGIAAVSYFLTKQWVDKNDPARKRMKDIKDAVEARAVHRWVPKLTLTDKGLQDSLGQDRALRMGQQ